MLRLIAAEEEGEEGKIGRKGRLSEKIIYAVFLVSPVLTHMLFLAIKTQATHDWIVKTNLENVL